MFFVRHKCKLTTLQLRNLLAGDKTESELILWQETPVAFRFIDWFTYPDLFTLPRKLNKTQELEAAGKDMETCYSQILLPGI